MTRRRPLALVHVACALVAVQLSGLVHVVAVPHIRCAEHGEWVDAPTQSDAPEANTAGDPQLAVVGAQAATLDHEHCSLLLHRVAASLSTASGELRAAITHLPNAGPREAALGQGSPLSLAPKQSPPGC